MSFLKKPFKKLKDLHPGSPANSSDSEKGVEGVSTPRSVTFSNGKATPNNGTATSDQKRQSREIIAADKKKLHDEKKHAKAEAKKRQSMAKIDDETFLKEGPPNLTKLYRPYSMNMSKKWNHENRILFKELDFASKSPRSASTSRRGLISSTEMEGTIISFRARIHTLRRMSAKLVFIVFRQQIITIQGVLQSFRPNEKLERKT